MRQPSHTCEVQQVGEQDRRRLADQEAEAARVRESKAAERKKAAAAATVKKPAADQAADQKEATS